MATEKYLADLAAKVRWHKWEAARLRVEAAACFDAARASLTSDGAVVNLRGAARARAIGPVERWERRGLDLQRRAGNHEHSASWMEGRIRKNGRGDLLDGTDS